MSLEGDKIQYELFYKLGNTGRDFKYREPF